MFNNNLATSTSSHVAAMCKTRAVNIRGKKKYDKLRPKKWADD